MSEIILSRATGVLCLLAGLACCDQVVKGAWSPGGWREDLRTCIGLLGALGFIFAAVAVVVETWP